MGSFNQWFRLGEFSGTCGDKKFNILLKTIWASVIPILLCIFKILSYQFCFGLDISEAGRYLLLIFAANIWQSWMHLT